MIDLGRGQQFAVGEGNLLVDLRHHDARLRHSGPYVVADEPEGMVAVRIGRADLHHSDIAAMIPASIIGPIWPTWTGMTLSLCSLVSERSAPIAPMLDRAKLSVASGVNRPEKLVAMKAERPPMSRP